MLVLALQFSRGDMTHAELGTSSTQRRRREVDSHSLKTEEKTVTDGGRARGRDRIPGDLEVGRLTAHQCTNRCVSNWIVRMTTFSREALLRKEVIQPHLPVRLPCYDFTPITDPTFDGSLPYGLGHRLRVLPTFVV